MLTHIQASVLPPPLGCWLNIGMNGLPSLCATAVVSLVHVAAAARLPAPVTGAGAHTNLSSGLCTEKSSTSTWFFLRAAAISVNSPTNSATATPRASCTLTHSCTSPCSSATALSCHRLSMAGPGMVGRALLFAPDPPVSLLSGRAAGINSKSNTQSAWAQECPATRTEAAGVGCWCLPNKALLCPYRLSKAQQPFLDSSIGLQCRARTLFPLPHFCVQRVNRE